MTLRRRLLVPLVVVAGAAALAAVSVQRIPDGSVGLVPGGIAAPGWRLHAPLRPSRLVPARGTIVVDDVALATKEGSSLVFRLDLSYEIGTRLAPQLASDAWSSGLSGAVRTLAGHVLVDTAGRLDAEALLASPAIAEESLRAALEGAGLSVLKLTFRSPLGDELARRRETDRAMALVRPAPGKVLVIGWDGADWDSIRPLVADGRMPNLAKFLREGASGDLRSYDPMFSPLLWTTVATGKAPTEHGIADFLVKDVATGNRRPITSDFRKVKALWNIFTDFGRRSSWVAWWASYPAEDIDGVLVSDLLTSSVIRSGPAEAVKLARVATPADFLASRVSLLVPWQAVTREDVAQFFAVSEDEWQRARAELMQPSAKADRAKGQDEGADDPVAFMIRMLCAMRTYHAVAKDLVRGGSPFVATYYEGPDMMGHRFQHYLPPKMNMVSPAEFDRFRDAVPRWYAYQDALLGDLLAVTPPDTTVVILSDHGFLTGARRPEGLLPYTKGQPVEWHRAWGVLALRGPGIRAGALPPSSIFDLAPTLLYLEGLPLADDMPGRLIDAAFTPEVLRRNPPRSIRSYELAGARLAGASRVTVDAGAMEEMMANLRALGYVGGEPAAPAVPPDRSRAADRPAEGPAATPGDARATTQYFYHRNLAVSYIRQGRYKEAEAELLEANERQAFGKTFSMLSEVRADQGRFVDAAAALEDGWRRVPSSMDPGSLLWIVELHLLAGDRAAAEAAAGRWRSAMTPALTLAVDGRLRDADGDTAGATALYRRALEQDPLLVRVAQRLHEVDLAEGHPFEMEPFLLDTLRGHPDVDAYWDLAGQLALGRGDPAEAASRFRKATDLEPENGLYLGHLGSAYAAAGRTKDARDALAWADRFPPRDGEAWMALGAAWDRLGEPDRAVRAFDAAKTSGSPGPGADIGAVLALARAGRTAEARQRLADAASRFPDSGAIRQLSARLGG